MFQGIDFELERNEANKRVSIISYLSTTNASKKFILNHLLCKMHI